MINNRKDNANQGFALLEVLIAVLIFSIGLLGLAGLQVTSLKFTGGAYQLTQFSEISYAMTDRMRANMPAVIKGYYRSDFNFNFLDKKDNRPTDPGFNCVTSFGEDSNGCTAEQMAQAELYQWVTRLATHFQGGWRVTITCDDAGAPRCKRGSIHTISIAWREPAGMEAEDLDHDGIADDKAMDGIVTRTFSTSFQAGRRL